MAFLTRRSYRRKRIVGGLSLFMALALISSGFATFVISSQSNKDGQGNVQVGTVSDKAMTITIDNDDNLGSFVLDTKKIDNRGAVRSDATTTQEENLSITITGSITNFDYLGKLNIRLSALEDEDTFLEDAVEKGYIVLPECASIDGYNFTNEEINAVKNASGKFSYTISLKWGSAFNYLNPGFYYDNEVYEKDKWVAITENKFEGTGEDIKATLTDLRRTFHDVPSDITNDEFFETQDRYAARKYKVTVTVSTQ